MIVTIIPPQFLPTPVNTPEEANIALETTMKSRGEVVQLGLKTRDLRARFWTHHSLPCGVMIPTPRKEDPTTTQVGFSVVIGNARAPRAFWIAIHGTQANSILG